MMKLFKACVLLLYLMSIIGEGYATDNDNGEEAINACQNLEYNFDNTGDKEEYLEALDSLPNMEYFTICTKATTSKLGALTGTVGSYVTGDAIDILTAGGEMSADGKALLRIAVNGEVKLLITPLMPETEYTFCLRYHLPLGYIRTYINGQFVQKVGYKAGSIPAGGKVMIGQRQTCYKDHGGCFEKAKAYTGKIKDFMIWDRALTDEEIAGIAVSNECPSGPIVTTKPERVIPAGKFYTYHACPSSDFTLKNEGKSLQYVEVTKPFQLGEYFTICAQTTTDATGMIPGAFGSYATAEKLDVLSARGQRDTGEEKAKMRVSVNGQSNVVDAQLAPVIKEYGLCLSYRLPRNQIIPYTNGRFIREIPFSNVGSIPASGKLIIGQHQTCYAKCFDRKHAFNGRLRNLMVWKRVLSEEEMTAYSMSDECPTDHIIDLTPDNAKFVQKTL